MADESNDDLIEKLVSKNSLCVIGTASNDGNPEAATIEYVKGPEGDFYFATKRGNVKYKNLKSNPKAAMVVTEGKYTVQVYGSVEELKGDEASTVSHIMTKELGQNPNIYSGGEWRIFRLKVMDIHLGVFPKLSESSRFTEK